jgi:hypothetical protein
MCASASIPSSIPTQNDTYQIDRAREAIERGGLFGVGPGEGTVKRVLPDAHTDFVYSVAGEEFGLVLLTLADAAVRRDRHQGCDGRFARHQDTYPARRRRWVSIRSSACRRR